MAIFQTQMSKCHDRFDYLEKKNVFCIDKPFFGQLQSIEESFARTTLFN